MGRERHSKGAAFGRGNLCSLVEQVLEGDGCRYDEHGARSHKGLPQDRRLDENWTPRSVTPSFDLE